MKKDIFTYLIILAFNPTFGQSNKSDTIKITLHINDKLIAEPFQFINISFNTPRQQQQIKLDKNYILISSLIPDTSEIVIFYNKNEISRCFKYAPKTLLRLGGLDIKIMTSKKAIRKELNNTADPNSENYGKLKSICNVSTIPKDGDGVNCTVKNWTQTPKQKR